ncbi:YaaL family protein [Marinilactibacillus kalidii]|uniref:YaaL family protein n=1 Tax=Marinilactibacillus kalidii TaxID=2820274 RepID=UPI001ABDBB0B|nr:YaaL family protein [Marinilactibacillus kalidii]
MGLFKRKPKLKNQYDGYLLTLMNHLKTEWEQSKVMEEIIVEEHPKLKAERKLSQAKYFYLFKEAKIREIKGK